MVSFITFYNKSIRETNQHLKEWNVSAAQFDVLAQVGGHDRLTQQELGNKLFVTKGNITQLLNKMEQLEWIRREQEGTTKYISLTEKEELYMKKSSRLKKHSKRSSFKI